MQPVPERRDEELIALFLAERNSPAGSDAFKELYHRYHSRIVAWCARFTGDADSALDLSQEVFLRVFKHLAGFRGDSKFSTWVYVIARNQCVEAIEKRASEPVHAGGPLSPHLPDLRHLNAYASIERKQFTRSFWRLVASTLDPVEAEVMVLHYNREIRLDAITRQLGLRNESGAKAYIVSARRKLNRAIRSQPGHQIADRRAS